MTAAESPDTPLCASVVAANAGSGATEPENARATLSLIREIGVIRNLQPNDAVVITVPAHTTADVIARIGRMTKQHLGCYVLVVPEDVTVGHRVPPAL